MAKKTSIKTTWENFRRISQGKTFIIEDGLVHFQLTHYSWPICSPGRKTVSRKDVKELLWSRKLSEITCPDCAILKIMELQGNIKELRKNANILK